MSDWEYHQDGRDLAATVGLAAIAAIFAVLVTTVAVLAFLGGSGGGRVTACPPAPDWWATSPGDGSTAGANAVTLEEIEPQASHDGR